MVPQERWLLGGYGEYEVAEGINAYTEVTFINNRVENELAATPITQNVDFSLAAIAAARLRGRRGPAADDRGQPAGRPIALAAARGNPNPFGAGAGPFAALAPGCADPDGAGPLIADPAPAISSASRSIRARPSIASRNQADDRNAFRVLAGFRGNLTDSLSYDVYYMFSRTRNSQIQEGNVSRSNFITNAANGTCNVFGANLLSQECIDNISILAQNTDDLAAAGRSGQHLRAAVHARLGQRSGRLRGRRRVAQHVGPVHPGYGSVLGRRRRLQRRRSDRGRLRCEGGFRRNPHPDRPGRLHPPARAERRGPLLRLLARRRRRRLDLFGGLRVRADPGHRLPRPVSARDPRAERARSCSAATRSASRRRPIRAPWRPRSRPARRSATLCIATGVPAANVGQAFLQPNAADSRAPSAATRTCRKRSPTPGRPAWCFVRASSRGSTSRSIITISRSTTAISVGRRLREQRPEPLLQRHPGCELARSAA